MGVIRAAKFADLPKIADLMTEMYERSKYKARDEIDMKEAKALVMQSIQRHGLKTLGGTCVYVIEGEGKLDGFIIGVLKRTYDIGKKLQATDWFFYAREGVEPRSPIALFDKYLAWAEAIPDLVSLVNGATDAIGDPGRVEFLYRRRGFVQCGVIYERVRT